MVTKAMLQNITRNTAPVRQMGTVISLAIPMSFEVAGTSQRSGQIPWRKLKETEIIFVKRREMVTKVL